MNAGKIMTKETKHDALSSFLPSSVIKREISQIQSIRRLIKNVLPKH